jgi:hypothetical protein
MAAVGISARTRFSLGHINDFQELFFVAFGQCATPGSMFDGTSLRLMGGSLSRESGAGVSSSV